LLYLGGFDVRKNVSGILRAFARLGAWGAHADLHLVIAGVLPCQDNATFPSPRRVVAELGITERVRFAGWVDEEDKPVLYSAAIAFLFPSHYEGFGLPPLEAMACGTPVIVSDRSSLPEIVGDGGLCVDADDPDAIARAMDRVLGDTSLHARLRQAALIQARRFSWRRTAQETITAYQLALQSS
jgi:glycosyltransferase involved in cell wall biosynthesis